MDRTTIEFRKSNCAWCINNTAAELRSMTPVREVRLRPDVGCIEVDHEFADPRQLLDGVRRGLHRWVLADNGERMIVDVDAHPSAECPFRPAVRGGQVRSGRG